MFATSLFILIEDVQHFVNFGKNVLNEIRSSCTTWYGNRLFDNAFVFNDAILLRQFIEMIVFEYLSLVVFTPVSILTESLAQLSQNKLKLCSNWFFT